MAEKSKLANADNEQVLITRMFDAPRELVFKAWTDPQELVKWYAPTGCNISFPIIDVREGGNYLSCIRVPNGKECWCVGVYLEIKSPERIVQTMCISDANGNKISATEAEMDPEWPTETILTITFEDNGGQTLLTLHQTVSESLAKRTGAFPSWIVMFDRLDKLLETVV